MASGMGGGSASRVHKAEIEVLDYEDLVNGVDLSASIERAFGIGGCGILTVKNVPGLEEARRGLLPLAKDFAELGKNIL